MTKRKIMLQMGIMVIKSTSTSVNILFVNGEFLVFDAQVSILYDNGTMTQPNECFALWLCFLLSEL